MILCDIGNTTFNFCINGKKEKYLLSEDIPSFEETVYYISVNDQGSEKLKSRNKNTFNLQSHFDFKTQYKGMGIDRIVACYNMENCIVVDAGSAITVDVMEKKEHKGGFILLGISSLIEQYPKISKKLLFDFNTKVNLDKIPLCTQDAISFAILQSIIEPIKKLCENKDLIFTGGDGEFLSHFFDRSIYKEDLIFENMKGIINANNCITKG